MGVLGTAIHSDNPHLAQLLDNAHDALEATNELHKSLARSYRTVADAVASFDLHLMMLLTMQYHLAYAAEDLVSLPEYDLQTLSESFVERVEGIATDTFTAQMAACGFKAVKARVANLFKEGSIVRRAAADRDASVGAKLNAEVDATALRIPLLRSLTIDLLTTRNGGHALKVMASELGMEARILKEVADTARYERSVVGGDVQAVRGIADDAAAAARAGVLAVRASVSAAVEPGTPALLSTGALVIGTTADLLATIHRDRDRAMLMEAASVLPRRQSESDHSIAELKELLTLLLRAGKNSLDAYNALLPLLKAAGISPGDRTFSTMGVQAYIDGLEAITASNPGAIGWFQAAALENLLDGCRFIRAHVRHDAALTGVVNRIRTRMRLRGLDDLDDQDPFLLEVAQDTRLDARTVRNYNQFRRQVASLAAVLKPYHDQIARETRDRAFVPVKPVLPPLDPPDPRFDARPHAFMFRVGGEAAAV